MLEDIKESEAIEDAGFEAEPVVTGAKTQATGWSVYNRRYDMCSFVLTQLNVLLPGVKRAVVPLARDIVTTIEDAGFEGSLVQSNQQDKFHY